MRRLRWAIAIRGWCGWWQSGPHGAQRQDIRRVPTDSTDSQVGSEQVEALTQRNARPKVVVADSLYCNVVFLEIFLTVQTVYALVRMRSNRVLYENRRSASRTRRDDHESTETSSNLRLLPVNLTERKRPRSLVRRSC